MGFARKKVATISSDTSNISNLPHLVMNGADSNDQRKIRFEDLFDVFIENSIYQPLSPSLEPVLRDMFECDKAILWIVDQLTQTLYSSQIKERVSFQDSLPGFVTMTKSVIQVKDPSNSPIGSILDNRLYPPKSSHFFFPLSNNGVVQLIKMKSSNGFNQKDTETARMLMHKFSVYSSSIFSSDSLIQTAMKLFEMSTDSNYIQSPNSILKHHFQCFNVIIHKYDATRNIAFEFNENQKTFVELKHERIGAAKQSLFLKKMLNSPNIKQIEGYDVSIDGETDAPFLVMTKELGLRLHYSISLKGRSNKFVSSDEIELDSIFGFVIGSITGFGNEADESHKASKLTEVIDAISMICSEYTLSELTERINSQIRYVLDCRNSYIAYTYKNGYNIIPGSIMSKVFESRTLLSLNEDETPLVYNAVGDGGFNDVPTSTLAMPILNENHDIISVVYAYSKEGRSGFLDFDKQIFGLLSNSIGICINQCIELKNKMKVFRDYEATSLEKIIKRLKKSTKCVRIACYVRDPEWKAVVENGPNLDDVRELDAAMRCASSNKTYNLDPTNTSKLSTMVEVYPILSKDKNHIASLAFTYKKKYDDFLPYVTFFSPFIEKYSHKSIKLFDIIDEDEKSNYKAAAYIRISDSIYFTDFDTSGLNDIAQYQVVFKIFHRFNMFESYSISNECLFMFLQRISLSKVGVDSLQFLSALLISSHADKRINKLTILSMMIASLVTDFTTNSPITEESIEATNRIIDLLKVLSFDPTNILKNISVSDFNGAWEMIIQYVLACDPARYFEVITHAENNSGEESSRMSDSLICLIMSCISIRGLLRPKKIADKEKDNICESYWRRGSIYNCQGIVFIEGFSDRDHINKEKSQIAFFKGVALKMLNVAAGYLPQLHVLTKQLTENINYWELELFEKSK